MSDFTRRLLRVNLSKAFCSREDIPEKTVMDFVDGLESRLAEKIAVYFIPPAVGG